MSSMFVDIIKVLIL